MACQIDTCEHEQRKTHVKGIFAIPTKGLLYCHHPANATGMPRSRPSTTTAPVLAPMGFSAGVLLALGHQMQGTIPHFRLVCSPSASPPPAACACWTGTTLGSLGCREHLFTRHLLVYILVACSQVHIFPGPIAFVGAWSEAESRHIQPGRPIFFTLQLCRPSLRW